MYRFLSVLLISILIASASPGRAQHMQHQGGAAIEQPYAIQVFGGFRKMMMERDYSPRIALADAVKNGTTDGVGAVSGLRGEITVLDGKPIVSYGTGSSGEANETAALLVVASAHGWQEIKVDRDLVDGKEIEAFIVDHAKTRGIDPASSFPFRFKGELTGYAMHVNAAPNPAFQGHGSSQPMAIADVREGDSLRGIVVGVLVAPALVGVATHPMDRSHNHWVSEDGERTAHLDSFGIKAGATLMLPSGT